MGFERFGIVNFAAQTKVDGFVDRLQEGNVSGSKCRHCGIRYFPPRADCCGCMSSDMEWFGIGEKGKLISYSTLSYAPTGFEADLPYTIALVRFDRDVQIFGRLSKTIKSDEIAVGMDLRVVPVELPDDRIAYEFVKP
jgi:uncharacterized OB-fold protein